MFVQRLARLDRLSEVHVQSVMKLQLEVGVAMLWVALGVEDCFREALVSTERTHGYIPCLLTGRPGGAGSFVREGVRAGCIVIVH